MGTTLTTRLIFRPEWAGIVNAIGGGPVLVRDGGPVFSALEAFSSDVLLPRAPRTAVGQLADGRVILVATDGRQPGYSVGMTNFELAQTLSRLGAVAGAALDGGGSTTLAFEGTVLNRPSDRSERPIADALLLLYTGVFAPPPARQLVSPNRDGVADDQRLTYKVVRPSAVTVTLTAPDGTAAFTETAQREPGLYEVAFPLLPPPPPPPEEPVPPQPLQQPERFLRQRLGHPARREPARTAAPEPGEEALALDAQALGLGAQLARVEARGLELALHVAHQLLDLVRGDLHAEVLRRHVLDQVRLVEDERVVGRDHRAVAAVLHREIGAQQMVVHHHDVGFECRLAHARDEAGVEQRARLADAVLARGRDLAPEVDAVRHVGDLGPVAGLGLGRPRLDGPVDRQLFEPPEAAGLAEGGEAQQAQVVGSALHHRDAQLASERLREQRQVLLDELLLQVLGAGRDHDAPLGKHRRQQVGERLAGAGAGLGQQQPAVLEHFGYRLREPDLRLSLLVAGQHPGERSAR